MSNKDKKRHFAYEALLLLGCLAMLLFITRLWPLLLLAILWIFAAVIRLLFLSTKKVETIVPKPLPQPKSKPPTYADVQEMAFGLIQIRISELVKSRFPDARWVWENARPRDDVAAGRPVHILLNRAGGYRRAQVLVQNLQVCDVLFDTKKPEENETVTGDNPEDTSPLPEESPDDDDVEVNYGLIAFEWVDAHVLELNERLNEAIAQGASEFMVPEAELPERDSWPEICQELVRNGLEGPECCEAGIRITCKQ